MAASVLTYFLNPNANLKSSIINRFYLAKWTIKNQVPKEEDKFGWNWQNLAASKKLVFRKIPDIYPASFIGKITHQINRPWFENTGNCTSYRQKL